MIAIKFFQYKILLQAFFLIFFLYTFLVVSCDNQSAITYTFEGAGRFGDCAMIYCKAKYYSLKYGLPLLYKPFQFSDELTLHYVEKMWTRAAEDQFLYKRRIACAGDINGRQADTLFVVDLFTNLEDVAFKITHKALEPVDHWINLFADEIFLRMQSDSLYRQVIKEMLKPVQALAVPEQPNDHISVAVHVRKGGGYDGDLWSQQLYTTTKRTCVKAVQTSHWVADCACPLRFPPEQFYIDQINALSELVDKAPMYVQIFTDDACPQDLLERFRERCTGVGTITLGTTEQWQHRTIADIYTMSSFDVLIRPCSFFSGVAQLLGDHAVIIKPDDFCFDNEALYITDSICIVNDDHRIKIFKVPFECIQENFLKSVVCKVLSINRPKIVET